MRANHPLKGVDLVLCAGDLDGQGPARDVDDPRLEDLRELHDVGAVLDRRLNPEERRKLDKLVQAFKEGQVTAAQKSAAGAIEAKRTAEAEAQAAKEEARVAKEEAKAAKIESKASDRGFLAKAKVLLVPGTKIEYAEIRSTIEGTFEGWDGKTIFHLANGQRWKVVNSGDRYFVPPQQNVEAVISPAVLGGYWMSFPSLDARVRVKLLTDK